MKSCHDMISCYDMTLCHRPLGGLIGSLFYIFWLPELSQSSSRPPRVPAWQDLGQGRVRAGSGEVASSQVPRIAARSAFLEHATGATGATGAGEVVSRTVARTPPPTHAGGQDDGSYTNSLKLYYQMSCASFQGRSCFSSPGGVARRVA